MNQVISVIIPLYRARAEDIAHLIDALKCQSLVPDEILLVETRENGRPLRVPRTPGVRHLLVPHGEFDHGGTRNLAVRSAAGDLVVFLSQDAVPADDQFIENLVRPLSDPQTPASYGRHIPLPHAKPTEQFARLFNYPDKPVRKGAGLIFYMGIKAVFFSNVCGAFRRDAWEEVGGFPDRIILSEDLVLATKLVRSGYQVAYVPSARVLHSHDYSLSRQFQRYFDIGSMLSENAARYGIPSPDSEGFRFLRHQLRFLASNGHIHWMPYALGEAASKFLGYRIGRLSRFLPDRLNSFLSMNDGFWTASLRPGALSEVRAEREEAALQS